MGASEVCHTQEWSLDSGVEMSRSEQAEAGLAGCGGEVPGASPTGGNRPNQTVPLAWCLPSSLRSWEPAQRATRVPGGGQSCRRACCSQSPLTPAPFLPSGGSWPRPSDLPGRSHGSGSVSPSFQRTLGKQHTCLCISFPKVGVFFLLREHEGQNKPGILLLWAVGHFPVCFCVLRWGKPPSEYEV